MRGEVRPRAPLLGWANQPSARLQKRGGDGGPVIAGAEEEGGDPLDGDRTELVVDTETFRPLLLRIHNEGTDVRGRWFTYDFSEHVRTWTTLPDTPENRLQLELRGPTG